MKQNKINILCTRPLDELLVHKAAGKGIDITVLAFIQTETIRSIAEQQEIESALLLPATVVFTSMNAVDAVTLELDGHQPDWTIYCIGNTTRNKVREYFGEDAIAGTADSAGELAGLIVEEGETDEVIFFCGNRRRDELPRILREHDIEVNEIVVYQTLATPHRIKIPYQGILFFSPSAVESFFSVNKIPAQTLLFAIGNTTAEEIRKYTNNTIITSDEPGKESLVEKMMEYFS